MKANKSELSKIAQKAVRTRRRKHPGGSKERLDANLVEQRFRRHERFTTADIMHEFNAAKDNATAVAAILRLRRLTEKMGTAPDGTSIWRWVTT
jgi:hypothetical protein